jgi:3-hydroxybutyryl-CoA dehydrogenase
MTNFAAPIRLPASDGTSTKRGRGVVNYPRGLLAWGDGLGAAQVLATLESLQAEYGEDRYRPSPLLRRVAKTGGRLLS